MDDARTILRKRLQQTLSERVIQHVLFTQTGAPPPQYAFVVHFPSIVLALKGGYPIELSQGGRVVDHLLRPGDVLYAGPNCWYRPTWRQKSEALTILFGRKHTGFSLVRNRPRPGMEPDLHVTKYHAAVPLGNLSQELLQLCEQARRPGHHGGIAVHLVHALLLSCDELLDESKPSTVTRPRQVYDGVCSHVQAHFHQALTRESVAAEFGITPNHLSRLFRIQGLMRFWDYITWVRIDRAKWLLVHYDIPVKEVARHCGFEQSSYFCRVFRQRTKLTPVAYRLKYRHQHQDDATSDQGGSE
ncbi:MAG: helix-turn-helix transcriptional regulator [Phycisphaerae bacterium]|nr:helix-turn-helix transcriptional regulator [Phycisphaerae bacterium]